MKIVKAIIFVFIIFMVIAIVVAFWFVFNPPLGSSTNSTSLIYNTSIRNRWAGYWLSSADLNNESITMISANFIVPNCKSNDISNIEGTSFWIGIGGVNSDLLQAGASCVITNNYTSYVLFFQALPGGGQIFNNRTTLPLSSGDKVYVKIELANSTKRVWTLYLKSNATPNEVQISGIVFNSSNKSVDWMLEPLEYSLNQSRLKRYPASFSPSVTFSNMSFSLCKTKLGCSQYTLARYISNMKTPWIKRFEVVNNSLNYSLIPSDISLINNTFNVAYISKSK